MEYRDINWYPGHMAKTKRLISENIGKTDIIAEIVDARIPFSSRNPDIDGLVGNKPRIIVLNKSDVADVAENDRWKTYFEKSGYAVIKTDCRSGKGIKEFIPTVKNILSEKIEARRKKGIENIGITVMMLGVPNVGKSSLINRLASSKRAAVEDRPGVTRGKQRIALENGFDLIDMPGILWGKIDTPQKGANLAVCGSVKDEILDPEYLSAYLLYSIKDNYSQLLKSRYKIEISNEDDGYILLEKIARKRGFLLRGGICDTERASKIILDEFRGGVIGRISLETVSML